MTMVCRMCGIGELAGELNFGTAAYCVDAPPSAAAARRIAKHPFRLATCQVCGVIEMMDLPPLEALRPTERATLYRDPERHLDDLARVTASLMTSPNTLIMGMTYKDVPLLERLAALGLTHQYRLDRDVDWGLHDARAGIETIQARCTLEWAEAMRQKHGRVSLLLVRHLLEHAHDPASFLAACRRLTEPDGLVLIEVPGCETELARGDAGTLWEEHIHYFTMPSLRRALSFHGFESLIVGNYPYTIEDCLVTIGRFGAVAASATQAETSLLREFSMRHTTVQRRVRELAAGLHGQGRRVAVYGAGHRTATWIELTRLADIVDCVIDDDPAKQGHFLAGSGLPVGPSQWLLERQIGACIGLLSVDILRQIAARQRDYVDAGGCFLTLNDVVAGVASP